MPEQIHSFSKGMVSDYAFNSQPEGTFFNAKGWRITDTGDLVTQKGTKLFTNLPSDLRLIGAAELGDELIVLLVDLLNTISEIGSVSSNGTYTGILRTGAGTSTGVNYSSNILSFDINNEIDIISRTLFTGERMIYFVSKSFPPRAINLDNIPSESNLDKDTRLFFNFNLGIVKLIDVDVGGSLPTGIYQFAVRYISREGNKTGVGPVSQTIPVTDEASNVGRENFDGALPETDSGKSINIKIDNVDTSFPIVEIIAIHYEGLASVFTADVVGRIPTETAITESNGNKTLDFTYNNTDQKSGGLERVDLSPLGNQYDRATSINQTQGRAVLSNLKAVIDDTDWQSIANNITVDYFIKEVTVNEGFTTKVDGEVFSISSNIASNWQRTEPVEITNQGTNSFEDYKGEKQTFELVGYMRDEVYDIAIVPIFKTGRIGAAYHIPGNHTVNTPASGGVMGTFVSSEAYPSGFGYPSGNVRFHHTPGNDVEPFVVRISNDQKVKVLGIKLKNVVIPQSAKDLIQGLYVVRQKRNNSGDGFNIAQGIFKPVIESNVGNDNFVFPAPSFGRQFLQLDSTVLDNNSIKRKLISAYMPDIIHGLIEPASLTHYRKSATVTPKRLFDSRLQDSEAFTVANVLNFDSGTGVLGTEKVLTGNKHKVTPYFDAVSGNDNSNNRKTSLPFSGNPELRIAESNGSLLLEAESDEGDFDLNPEFYFNQGSTWIYRVDTEAPTLNIYTLRNKVANPYSGITSASYIKCAEYFLNQERKSIVDDSVLPDTEIEVFGGDTFITKVAILMADRGGIHTESQLIFPPKSRSIVYTWFETKGNYNYKHFESPTIEAGALNQGTIPYFPKYSKILNRDGEDGDLGLFNFFPDKGHSIGYNKQYNRQNEVQIFFPIPLLFQQISNFSNRSIYSEALLEGEHLDAYRIFLPNNFQDLPRNTGEIINTFNWANDFYIRTEKSLYKTFTNPVSQAATTTGELVLGKGDFFSIQPKPIVDIDGGFLGTKYKWGDTETPFGYILLDSVRGKVFLFNQQLEEISDKGISNFFFDNLTEDLNDNPSKDSGYHSFYDHKHKRVFISRGTSGGFTISYSLKLGFWESFSNFIPRRAVKFKKKLLLDKNQALWSFGEGEIGKFFNDTKLPFTLEFIANVPNVDKVFDVLLINNIVRDVGGSGKFVKRTFDRIQVRNDTQNTGKANIVLTDSLNGLNRNEVKAAYRNSEYRVHVPFNSVIDESDIEVVDFEKQFKDRMKGKYSRFILEFDSADGEDNEMTLNYIISIFRRHTV